MIGTNRIGASKPSHVPTNQTSSGTKSLVNSTSNLSTESSAQPTSKPAISDMGDFEAIMAEIQRAEQEAREQQGGKKKKNTVRKASDINELDRLLEESNKELQARAATKGTKSTM